MAPVIYRGINARLIQIYGIDLGLLNVMELPARGALQTLRL